MNALVPMFLWLAGSLNSLRQGPVRSRPRRVREFQPALEQLDQRLLPSLTPVTPPAGSPLQAVVELQVTYPDHQMSVGTGAMINSSHVLTAAHLLYSARDGGYAVSVEAIPDANGSRTPFGVAFGTYERVDPSWLGFNQSHAGMTSPSVEDIGLVTLNRAIGASTGWFGIGSNNNNAFFTGAAFQTAGYPVTGGLNGPQMYAETGKALGAASSAGIGFSQSSLTAVPGQSGSPIYQASAHGAVIYGVLTGADGFSSSSEVYAARITQSVYSELQSWEQADKTPPVFSNVTSASQVTLQHPAVTAAQLKGTAASTPAIYALDSSWWNPYYNAYANATCVITNFFGGNWGSNYYPQTWQQVIAPAPSNCIYYNPSNNSTYNDYYYDDYYGDDYYYV